MRARSLIILLLSLAVVAGLAALLVRGKVQGPSRSVLGSSLLPGFPVNEVASVTINSAGNSVSLVKEENGWVVQQRFDHPADLSKIAGLVHELEEVKVGRQFEGSEEILRRLALKDPEDPQASPAEKGRRIVLKGQDGKILASVLLGNLWQGAPDIRSYVGRYLRLGESNTVYLVDGKFQGVQGDPAFWLDRQLVEANPVEVKRITCATADGKRILYTFERGGPEKALEPTVGLPPSASFKDYELRRLATGLTTLTAQDVAGPTTAAAAAAFPLRIDYQLFDGTNYRVYFSRSCSQAGKDQCLLRLEASYAEPAADGEGETAGHHGKGAEKRAKTPAEPAAAAERLNERVSPWIYVVPWPQYYAFQTNLHLFLGPEKKSGEK